VAAAALAVAATFGIRTLGWSGTDLAAQVYRVGLFKAHGWIPYDLGWYGGHSLLSYSTLFPPLARTIGMYGAAACSAAVATLCFARLTRDRFGDAGRAGVVVFALGTVVPVAIGQLPFLLAEALGLAALVAAERRSRSLALTLAVACGLSNAVAAAFLAMAAVAWAITEARTRVLRAAIALAALAPSLVLAAAFSTPGRFPFPGSQLIDILIVCGVGLIALPARERTIRWGLAAYAAAAIVAFVIPNPMGGNMGRLATTFGPALAMMAAWHGRQLLLAGLAIFLVGWQWAPLTSIASRGPVLSSRESYYTPLLAQLADQPVSGRVEVPPMQGHWEAAYVAPAVPLARGWERQIDIAHNPLFYVDDAIDPAVYQRWLHDNGVTWVAVADAPLDRSAQAEAALIRTGLPYLQLAWHDPHWSLWRVTGATGLLSGAARLVSMGPDRVHLNVSEAGPITLRVRYTARWAVKHGNACVGPTPDGWTRLVVRAPGVVDLGLSLMPASTPRC